MTIYVIGPGGPDLPNGNETIYVGVDGEREHPCRCGTTHRGRYAYEDWLHHNCFHNQPLIEIDPEELAGYLMCPACGKTFWLATSSESEQEEPA